LEEAKYGALVLKQYWGRCVFEDGIGLHVFWMPEETVILALIHTVGKPPHRLTINSSIPTMHCVTNTEGTMQLGKHC
jgi:hypothetical protein